TSKDDAFEKGIRFLRRMSSTLLFRTPGRGDTPYRPHLAAGFLERIACPVRVLQQGVVEHVRDIAAFLGPDERLVARRKIPGAQVRGGIWFEPADVVQDMVPEPLE